MSVYNSGSAGARNHRQRPRWHVSSYAAARRAILQALHGYDVIANVCKDVDNTYMHEQIDDAIVEYDLLRSALAALDHEEGLRRRREARAKRKVSK